MSPTLGRVQFFVLVRSRQILDNFNFKGLRLDSHEKVNMGAASFVPNSQTIVKFMSILVSNLAFLALFRVEHNFDRFLIF